ncbi:hypothetical protein [Streptomyces sp. SPB074]|uniref:hypothetical protein n=1 Tax=Streptomyces sp. (strain SPB074) TaxID=465543 RepID=UPI00017F0E82|nr:hypothetical protein [Streptomyces sp. SPB074]EDY43958.1 hypothetical protein SSBG_02148 [Streptomyces sp. SPB074]
MLVVDVTLTAGAEKRPSLAATANAASRHPNRRRPRSSGASLRARGAGIGFWDDEISADGGKRYLHHRARRLTRTETRAAIADAFLDRP